MTTNGANSRIQSEVHHVYRNGQTCTPSSANNPRRGNSQQIPQQVVSMYELPPVVLLDPTKWLTTPFLRRP
jgi:hypothetical protein